MIPNDNMCFQSPHYDVWQICEIIVEELIQIDIWNLMEHSQSSDHHTILPLSRKSCTAPLALNT